MALTGVKGYFVFRDPPKKSGLTTSFTNIVLNTASGKVAFIIQAPKTGTISKLCFRTGTVATGATVDVRLETVDAATGYPSGTLWGTNTNGSQVIADTDDITWFTTALTAGASVTMGDTVAIVIQNPATGYGNMNISGMASNIHGEFQLPYSANNTGSWAKVLAAPVTAMEYSDGSYEPIPGVLPFLGYQQANINVNTNPDELGWKVRFPFPVRIAGLWYSGYNSEDRLVKIYDANNNVLASKTFDKDITYSGGAGTQVTPCYLWLGATVDFAANTWYRVTMQSTSASSIQTHAYYLANSSIAGALPGGSDFIGTRRTDLGAWTDDAVGDSTWPILYGGLLISGFDTGEVVKGNPSSMLGGLLNL